MIVESPAKQQPRPLNTAGKQGSKNTLGLANDGYQSDTDLRAAASANVARIHLQKKRDHRPITEEDVNMQWKMALVGKYVDVVHCILLTLRLLIMKARRHLRSNYFPVSY